MTALHTFWECFPVVYFPRQTMRFYQSPFIPDLTISMPGFSALPNPAFVITGF